MLLLLTAVSACKLPVIQSLQTLQLFFEIDNMKIFPLLYSLLYRSIEPGKLPLEVSTHFENHNLSVAIQLHNVAAFPVAVQWGKGPSENIRDSDELQITCDGLTILPFLDDIFAVLTRDRKRTSFCWNPCVTRTAPAFRRRLHCPRTKW